MNKHPRPQRAELTGYQAKETSREKSANPTKPKGKLQSPKDQPQTEDPSPQLPQNPKATIPTDPLLAQKLVPVYMPYLTYIPTDSISQKLSYTTPRQKSIPAYKKTEF